jgi:hypothetical protein
MNQKTKTDLKTIIIALMIALGANWVIVFIETTKRKRGRFFFLFELNK